MGVKYPALGTDGGSLSGLVCAGACVSLCQLPHSAGDRGGRVCDGRPRGSSAGWGQPVVKSGLRRRNFDRVGERFKKALGDRAPGVYQSLAKATLHSACLFYGLWFDEVDRARFERKRGAFLKPRRADVTDEGFFLSENKVDG